MLNHIRRRPAPRLLPVLIAIATVIYLSIAADETAAVFSFWDPNDTVEAAERDKVARPAPVPTCVPAPSGRIGLWTGNGTGEDSAGSNDMTLIGGGGFIGSGYVGGAFSFVNAPNATTGQFAQNTNPAGLPLGNAPRTVNLWFRTDSNLAAATESALFEYGAQTGGQTFGLITSGNAPGRLYFYGNSADLAGTTTIQAGTWYFASVTYDGAVLKLYVNGQLENSASLGLNTVLDPNGLTIGLRPGSSVWNGQLDEIEIYDRALSESEIQAIYNAGSGGTCQSCTPTPNGLISWWGAENNTFDSGGSNDGTLQNGATFAAGKVGTAFSFDGVDDSFVVPDAASLDVTTEFTMEAWVNPAAAQGFHQGGILSKVGGPGGNNGYQLVLVGDNQIYCLFNGEGESWPGNILIANLTTPVPIGAWTHVACTYDHNDLKAFVNGEVVGTLNVGPKTVANSASNLRVSDDDNGNVRFNGRIDEPSLYSRALSQAEIQAMINADTQGKCRTCSAAPTGLVGWWSGDGNGYDIVNGNNGTENNGADYATGKVNSAFRFDGIDDFVSIPHRDNQNTGNTMSIAAWVRQDSPSVGAPILQKRSLANIGGFTLETPDNDHTALQFYLMIGGNWHGATTPGGVLEVGVWNYVVATYDGSRMKIFVDGIERTSVEQTGSIDPVTDPLVAGRSVGAGFYWHGQVDEVQLFNRAVTPEEIALNALSAGNCKPRAYVPNAGDETLSVIDVYGATVLDTISTGSPRQPSFVAISNDGSRVYVPHVQQTDLTVIDTANNSIAGSFTASATMHGAAVSGDGTRLYVAHRDGSNIWVYDTANGNLLATIPVGSNPYGVAASRDGKSVLVGNYFSGTVSIIRTLDNSVVTLNVGGVPYEIAITADSTRAYVTNLGNKITVIDVPNQAVITEIPLGSAPRGIAVNRAGTKVFAANDSTNLFEIDTSDNSIASIPIGYPTEGLSISSCGNFVYAAVPSANRVLRVDTNTNEVKTVLVGSQPYALGTFIAPLITDANVPPAPDSCLAKPDGMLAWWRGQYNALDLKKSHPGTLINGAGFGTGLAGTGFQLDGTNDYVSVPAFPMGTDWTVEGWVNPIACSDGAHCPVFARSAGNAEGLVLTYLGDGHPHAREFALNIGNGSSWQVGLYSTVKFSPGTWYHVAATKSGDEYKLYVDGSVRSAVIATGVDNAYNTRDIWLGHWNYGSDTYLQGKIDEVAVFNRALTGGEIAAIANVRTFGKCAAGSTPADFDGDLSTDLTIYRPVGGSGAEWWTLRSTTGGNWAATFGTATDKIVAEDFTGDGVTDVAIYRPSNNNWYILRSEDYSYYSFPFGTDGDIPVPADYDGDGIADPAVYRPSTGIWYVDKSTGGLIQERFGFPTDKPVPADYDGDGKVDIAIYRPSNGQWWLNRTHDGLIVFTFGNDSDKNVPGDFTGDGKADVAIYRPSEGNWYVLRSEDYTYFSFPFGLSDDIPAAGDFDGDGVFDGAVFRPSDGKWYLRRSSAGFTVIPFGTNGDIPVPGAFIR